MSIKPRFCSNCGQELASGASVKYCSNCGTVVKENNIEDIETKKDDTNKDESKSIPRNNRL